MGCRRDKLEFVAMLVLVGSWLIDSFVRLPLLLRTLHLAEIGDIGFALEEFVVIRMGDKDVNFLRILPPLYPRAIGTRFVLGTAAWHRHGRHHRLATGRLRFDQLPVLVNCLDGHGADGNIGGGGGIRLIGGAGQVVVD